MHIKYKQSNRKNLNKTKTFFRHHSSGWKIHRYTLTTPLHHRHLNWSKCFPYTFSHRWMVLHESLFYFIHFATPFSRFSSFNVQLYIVILGFDFNSSDLLIGSCLIKKNRFSLVNTQNKSVVSSEKFKKKVKFALKSIEIYTAIEQIAIFKVLC